MADGSAGELGLYRLSSGREVYHPLIQKGKARAGRLRGFGNAIVLPQATEFIRAFLEVEEEERGSE